MRLTSTFRFNEGETVPMGRCFQWAITEYLKNHLDNPQAKLVHARVTHTGHPEPYWHAWVEDDDRVYDWQTMDRGMSKYAKQGWPRAVFYREFKPTDVRAYQGPVGKYLTKHGHAGPWDLNEAFEIEEQGFGILFLKGENVCLVGGVRSGNSPAGHTRLKYQIYLTKDLKQKAGGEPPKEVGAIELMQKDGEVFDVVGINQFDIFVKRQGIGREVIRQLLDTVKHDLLIYDIGVYKNHMPVKSGTARALAFWKSMGAVNVNGQPLTDRHGQHGIIRYGDGSAPLPAEMLPKETKFNFSVSPAKPDSAPSPKQPRVLNITSDKPRVVKLRGFRKESLGEDEIADPFEASEKVRAFDALAQGQRGMPEAAMVRAQELLGGGVMSSCLEHIGDLTHRMAEKGGRYGAEFVRPKIEMGLRVLTHGYGFEREFRENIVANNRFRAEHPEYNYPEITPELEKKVLTRYWTEHAKLPVYNRMQECARNAAIRLGQLRFSECVAYLREIEAAIKDGTYDEKSQQYDPNYPGRVYR